MNCHSGDNKVQINADLFFFSFNSSYKFINTRVNFPNYYQVSLRGGEVQSGLVMSIKPAHAVLGVLIGGGVKKPQQRGVKELSQTQRALFYNSVLILTRTLFNCFWK